MKVTVEIEAGICGFHTKAAANSPDDQNVSFDVQTDCEKIRQLGDLLKTQGPFDVFQEIGPSPGSKVMQAARSLCSPPVRGLAFVPSCLTGPPGSSSRSGIFHMSVRGRPSPPLLLPMVPVEQSTRCPSSRERSR
jgi:hypothetical protein